MLGLVILVASGWVHTGGVRPGSHWWRQAGFTLVASGWFTLVASGRVHT